MRRIAIACIGLVFLLCASCASFERMVRHEGERKVEQIAEKKFEEMIERKVGEIVTDVLKTYGPFGLIPILGALGIKLGKMQERKKNGNGNGHASK